MKGLQAFAAPREESWSYEVLDTILALEISWKSIPQSKDVRSKCSGEILRPRQQ